MYKRLLGVLLLLTTFYVAEPKLGKLIGKIKKPKEASNPNEFVYPDEVNENCGLFNITDGDKAELVKAHQVVKPRFSWIVYLVHHTGGHYVPWCLATLLPDVDEESTSIVLTEATCIYNRKMLDTFYIYTGDDIPVDKSKLYQIESIAVDRTKANPSDHNAMVVTIQGEIPLDDERKVVCLPKPMETPPKDALCVLTSIRPSPKGPESTLYEAKYMAPRECKHISNEVTDMDSRIEACAFDRRQGSMLASGGSMLCDNNGRWVLYGIESYSGHIRQGYEGPHYDNQVRTSEQPSIVIDVGRFRQLMSDSKNLMKFGRINLMSMR